MHQGLIMRTRRWPPRLRSSRKARRRIVSPSRSSRREHPRTSAKARGTLTRMTPIPPPEGVGLAAAGILAGVNVII
eukprot:scaffold110490_cov75-Cyclotella_meneghiniana.AAC.3